MDLLTFRAFAQELEKRAVSSAATLRLLQARVGQGARIAPGLMAKAEGAAAAGMTRTAPTMRRMALDAGESARLQTRTNALAPVKSGLQSRMQQADAMGAASFDKTKPLRMHDAFNNTHGYSQAHINTLAGSSSRVADPKGLMAAAKPAPVGVPGRPSQEMGTVAARPRRMPAIDPHGSTALSAVPAGRRAA